MGKNPAVCSQCKGRCCKIMPGIAHPNEFRDKKAIKRAIKSGKWAIDWYEGTLCDDEDQKGYYVRPSTKGKEGVIYDPSWGGECTFLTSRGCKLSARKRPLQCRSFKADPRGYKHCKLTGKYTTKKSYALLWKPYWSFLGSFKI